MIFYLLRKSRPPSRASQTSGASPLRNAVALDGGRKAVGSFPKHGETPCKAPGAVAALRYRAFGESHSALPLQPYATQPPHLPTPPAIQGFADLRGYAPPACCRPRWRAKSGWVIS